MIIDLSHPITDKPPCTFSVADKVPTVTFEEGDSHGMFFVTSRLDNLYSNAGTQIDFPGHLFDTRIGRFVAHPSYPTIGEYPLDRFIGKTVVLDFSAKMGFLSRWFDEHGVFLRDQISDFAKFLGQLRSLEITPPELISAIEDSEATSLESLKGIMLYCGNTKYWAYEVFESWEYRYFYGPYFAQPTIEMLAEKQISFVGIDSFQIENPISKFGGDELPLMISEQARTAVRSQLSERRDSTNHALILGSGILIYESLRIPATAVGHVGDFSGVPLNMQLPGLDDDALVRPYMIID